MKHPYYSYPPGLFMRVAKDVVLLRRRNFHRDAQACMDHLRPPLQVLGRENIPRQGPCVLTINHYHRPGFEAQWFALAVAAVVPVQVHWVMTGEFTCMGKWYRPFVSFASRLLLPRIAKIYDFTTMPPMPPRPKDVALLAASVRAVLEYVRRAPDPVLGLAPEGYDPPGPAGLLAQPAAGAGRFGLLLARAGLAFVPVGAYELNGSFSLHFGEHYHLAVASELPAGEKDRAATQIIMEHTARLLPLRLRGEFA